MKKILLIITLVLLVTGCGSKKITCTLNNDKGIKSIETINIETKKDKVISAVATMEYSTEKIANAMCDIYKATGDANGNIICKGKTVTINNYHKAISEDDLTKDEIIKYFENLEYTCK